MTGAVFVNQDGCDSQVQSDDDDAVTRDALFCRGLGACLFAGFFLSGRFSPPCLVSIERAVCIQCCVVMSVAAPPSNKQ